MSKARPMLDDTPAAQLLGDAWRGIRDWTREMRVAKDLQGTVDRLHHYANLNLARNNGAAEYIGSMLLAQKPGNEDFRAFMISKRADGRSPFFKAADLTPDTTLQLLVQVGGKYPSRTYEGPGGKPADGPGLVLPTFSRESMNAEHGTNLSALQIMYFTCRAAKKVRAADWAEGMHAIVCAAIHEYASEHGLERDLKRKYTVRPPRLTDAEIRQQFEDMKQKGREALAQGVPYQRPSDGPVDTFNEMVGSMSRTQQVGLLRSLSDQLGMQVVVKGEQTPETALAAAVAAGKLKDVVPEPVASAPAKRAPARKRAAPAAR